MFLCFATPRLNMLRVLTESEKAVLFFGTDLGKCNGTRITVTNRLLITIFIIIIIIINIFVKRHGQSYRGADIR